MHCFVGSVCLFIILHSLSETRRYIYLWLLSQLKCSWLSMMGWWVGWDIADPKVLNTGIGQSHLIAWTWYGYRYALKLHKLTGSKLSVCWPTQLLLQIYSLLIMEKGEKIMESLPRACAHPAGFISLRTALRDCGSVLLSSVMQEATQSLCSWVCGGVLYPTWARNVVVSTPGAKVICNLCCKCVLHQDPRFG